MIVSGVQNLYYSSSVITSSGNITYQSNSGPPVTPQSSLSASIVGVQVDVFNRNLILIEKSKIDSFGTIYLNSKPLTVFSGSELFTASISGLPIRPIFSDEDVLKGVIFPINSGILDLNAEIYATVTGSSDFQSFLRGQESGQYFLNGYINGNDASSLDLNSTIRPLQNLDIILPASVTPTEPEPLTADIKAFHFRDLSSDIFSVEPVDIKGSINPIDFKNLKASLEGFQESLIYASISGLKTSDLKGIVLGVANEESYLTALINSDGDLDLGATITGKINDAVDLSANISGAPPANVAGSIFGVGPVNFPASILPNPLPVDLTGSVVGVLSPHYLTASVSSTGQYEDLNSYITPSHFLMNSLKASIEGFGSYDLLASINNDSQVTLESSISGIVGQSIKVLRADIIPSLESSIYASISGELPYLIGGSIIPIPPSILSASIFPEVFFIDVLIPFTTYEVSHLTASINSSNCDPFSSFSEMSASISSIFNKDLAATIIGANQLVKALDGLPIELKRQTIETNYLRLNLSSPTILTNYLPISIINSPIADLTASIFGQQAQEDLSAEIIVDTFGSFISSDPSEGIWVNLDTGEIKVISFYFIVTGKTYFFSEVSNTTFPESFRNNIKLVIETYSPIEEDANIAPTSLAQKFNVSRCVVSDLSHFTSWDSAVKYGIKCAVGLTFDLTASINPIGSSKELSASVDPIDSRFFRDLTSSVFPVESLPNLAASISGSGGLLDLSSFIRGFSYTSTIPSVTSSGLQESLQPIIITYSGEDPQIILQTIFTNASIVESERPDLRSSIFGLDLDLLNASISGTI